MIVSVGLPTCMEGMMYPIPFASPDQIVHIAQHAEALGYHSVWGNDHMTTQRYVRDEFAQPPRFWEPLITYSFLAAHTTRLRFGTGMLVTPMRRDIVVVAKQVATLDHFSAGRFILGLGVGAYREEFEALQPGTRAHRGNMLEESVQALQVLFTQRRASWHGQYYQFEDVELFPKPRQVPLPVYIGGNSPQAAQRAGAYADGWLPAGMPVEQLRGRLALLREAAAANGRDARRIDIAPQLIACIGKTRAAAIDRFRHSQMHKHLISLRNSTLKDQAETDLTEANLIGTTSQIVDKVGHLAEAGVTHLCGTYFCADSVSELLDQMQLLAEDVMPHLAAAA